MFSPVAQPPEFASPEIVLQKPSEPASSLTTLEESPESVSPDNVLQQRCEFVPSLTMLQQSQSVSPKTLLQQSPEPAFRLTGLQQSPGSVSLKTELQQLVETDHAAAIQSLLPPRLSCSSPQNMLIAGLCNSSPLKSLLSDCDHLLSLLGCSSIPLLLQGRHNSPVPACLTSWNSWSLGSC